MRKIDSVNVQIIVEEGSTERDKTTLVYVKYTVSDVQDPTLVKSATIKLSEKDSDGVLFSAYAAINAAEGTSYEMGKPQPTLTADDQAVFDCYRKLLCEYPTPFAWMEADYEARHGDTSKRDDLDKKIAAAKEKYPLPAVITTSTWERIKAFFGI